MFEQVAAIDRRSLRGCEYVLVIGEVRLLVTANASRLVAPVWVTVGWPERVTADNVQTDFPEKAVGCLRAARMLQQRTLRRALFMIDGLLVDGPGNVRLLRYVLDKFESPARLEGT